MHLLFINFDLIIQNNSFFPETFIDIVSNLLINKVIGFLIGVPIILSIYRRKAKMARPITTQQDGENDDDYQKRKTDAENYLALQKRLMDEQNMIGWLCTIHRNAVQYASVDSSITQNIQQQLNRASNLVSITYIWALLDEGGFNENTHWVTADERLELKAWKHVRHTGAHAPGSRANRYRNEFDQYMSGTLGAISGLRQNCTYDANSINLSDGMNGSFFSIRTEYGQ